MFRSAHDMRNSRITMRYVRARLPLDRQVNYVLAARVAGSI
jgi:hypothetical protein